MKNLFLLIRPQQWIKNLVIFLPVFFGRAILDSHAMLNSFITMLAFCLISSSIYCLNDIVDRNDDRKHPDKQCRPIASGRVSIHQAIALIVGLFSLGLLALVPLGTETLPTAGILLAYWFMNVAYCLKLKQYAIIDVCIIAFGFILRILAGGTAADITLSKWIVLMTFLLMLFLSFAKRRDDVLRMNETGLPPRKNTIRYNITFINQAITITASVTLVCYIMYTVSPEVIAHLNTEHLYLTSIFVLLGLLRYIQIAVVDKKSGEPTKIIIRDRFTQLIVLAFGLSYLFIIYIL